MEKELDYCIKDEGEFFTLCLISDRAKETFKKSFNGITLDFLYGNEILKIDIDMDAKNAIIIWGVSHNLRGESI